MCPCAAGAGAHHHHVDFSVALVNDLLRSAVVVGERVPGIAVLQRGAVTQMIHHALLIRFSGCFQPIDSISQSDSLCDINILKGFIALSLIDRHIVEETSTYLSLVASIKSIGFT